MKNENIKNIKLSMNKISWYNPICFEMSKFLECIVPILGKTIQYTVDSIICKIEIPKPFLDEIISCKEKTADGYTKINISSIVRYEKNNTTDTSFIDFGCEIRFDENTYYNPMTDSVVIKCVEVRILKGTNLYISKAELFDDDEF